MVGAKETSFWEARESARSAFVAIVLLTALLVHLLVNDAEDVQSLTTPIIFSVGALSATCSLVINTNLITTDKRHHQTAFSTFIALVSLLSTLHMYWVARFGFENGDTASFLNNSDRIIAKRMSQGGLPLHLATSLSMPLIATPAGMYVQWARYLSIFNLFIYALIVAAVYDQIKYNRYIGQERNDHILSLIYDVIAILPSFAVAYFSCLPGASISNDYVELLRAGRSADSMLNHILKNSIAGSACLLEMYQKALVEQGCQVRRKSKMLEQALDQLYKSMQWCSLRQVMMDLSGNRYQSTLSTVDVGAFLAGLCKGTASFLCEDSTLLNRQNTYGIAFDEKIALLAIENGVSNALSHGDRVTIKLKAEYLDSNSDGCGKICFSVENGLPPEKKRLITAQYLRNCRDRALCEIATRKLDSAGASRETVRKLNCSNNSNAIHMMTTSSRGNHLGLLHVGQACLGAGGSFDLFLQEEHGKDSLVVLQVVLPAQLVKKNVQNTCTLKTLPSVDSFVHTTTTDKFVKIPKGLRICAIDDSKVLTNFKLMPFHL